MGGVRVVSGAWSEGVRHGRGEGGEWYVEG